MHLSNVVSRSLLVLSLTIFSYSLSASERVLCLVTSDVDKEVGKMVYEMDEDGRGIKNLFKERYLNDKLIERVKLDPESLNGDGIVLHKKDKYITVRLYGHNFDQERGGVLYLDTLYNGVKGERKEYTIEAGVDGDKAQMTFNKKEFTRMNFVAKRSPLLGVIGIEKVEFSK